MSENQTIHDDSHARALLLRFMREGREHYINRAEPLTRKRKESGFRRYTFREYRRICKAQEELFGDTLIVTMRAKLSRSKRETSFLVTFGGFHLSKVDYANAKAEKLYPVVINTYESKLSANTGEARVLFFLSEHALIKMIRRSQCASIKDMVDIIREHIEPFIRCIIFDRTDVADFIALCAESYMPCTIGEQGVIIVESWIPRSAWNPATEAKLSQACEALLATGRYAIIPVNIFNQKPYWDGKLIEPFLTG